MNESRVIVIPKMQQVIIDANTGMQRKKKVCAYARVSTDFEDQLNSFDNQKKAYEEKISNNSQWEFVGLYSDEGITGTSLKRRDGFKQMVKDALNGKIDLILVKSISRFARNTVDCLKTKRELEAKGVEIFFEKENISSLDSGAETMLTIYASFAQEESRQISTNVTWGVRARMRSGKYIYGKKILGYINKGNNELVVNPDEAPTIKLIFEMFLNGFTYKEIINHLIKKELKTVKGDLNWCPSMIERILSNEKYCGDFVYQKTYCKNYLTHERAPNEGQVEQFLVANHHEAIISKDMFMYTQEVRRNRKQSYNAAMDNKANSPLSGLFQCAECGRNLQKIHYKRGNYDKYVLTCKYQLKNKKTYKRCEVQETIDFNLAFEFISSLVKANISRVKNDILSNAIIENKKVSTYYAQTKIIKENIACLENQLTTLIQDQVKKDLPIDHYKKEYERIRNEINKLKKTLSELEFDCSFATNNKVFRRDFDKYLEDDSFLTQRLISKIIKKVYRLKDNSLLVIKSDKNLDKEELEKIRIDIPKWFNIKPEFFKGKNGSLVYRTITIGE